MDGTSVNEIKIRRKDDYRNFGVTEYLLKMCQNRQKVKCLNIIKMKEMVE